MGIEKIEENVKPYDQNFTTMVPTDFVRKLRTNIIWQFIRFVIINIKMLLVVRKSH